MHVDKNGGISQNHNNIELQQQINPKQQASIFGNDFPDKNNNGIVDEKDFDDDSVIELLKNNKLLNCFWGDVYKKVNDLIHFTDKKIKVKTDTLYEIKRKDGYKIKIVSVNGSQPVLQIQGKDKSVDNISISFKSVKENDISDEVKDSRMQMLINALQELPTGVLQDLSQEVDEIRLQDYIYKSDPFIYGQSVNSLIQLSMDADFQGEKLSDIISHEIGHAVDQESDGFFTSNVLDENWRNEYYETYNIFQGTFKNLLYNYRDSNKTARILLSHSQYNMLGDCQEDFAYRYGRIEGNSKSMSEDDIINLITQFKNSNDKNEQYCYELFQKLDDIAQRVIEEKRQLPKEKRLRDHNVNKGYWDLDSTK